MVHRQRDRTPAFGIRSGREARPLGRGEEGAVHARIRGETRLLDELTREGDLIFDRRGMCRREAPIARRELA
ncbi:MAG: hypothetical protein AB7P99_07885 [Vicinamibacterales bacterium]